MSRWSKLTKHLTKDNLEVESKQPLPASLEGSDPELCIVLFKSTLNFHGLKKRIIGADSKWIEEFLQQDGLEIVFDALATLGSKGFNKSTAMMDAVQQLECISCIKTIMGRSCGMEHILMNGEKFVNRLIEELKSNNALLKMQVYELLSCLCVYSDEGYAGRGYQLSTAALQHYKKVNGERHQFSVLIKDLQKAETDQYCKEVLTFINCLLACCDDIEKRSSIRDDLAALNLMDILVKWRNTDDEELATQFDVFDAEFVVDEEMMMTEEGLDINNHRNVFRAIHNKVAGTPNALSFLHILQHLMLLDRDSKKCNMVWEMLEKIVLSSVLMSEGNQAAADHFISASTEKIKKALAQVVNDPASNATSLSSSSVASNTETPQASISESSLPPPVPLPTTSPVPPSSSIPPAPPPPASTVPPAPPPPPPTSGLPVPPPPPCPSGSVPAPPPLGNFGTAVTDDTLDPTLKSSFEFHSAKKLHILNWKKLSRNVVQAHKHCLWLQCTSNKSSDIEKINININTEQIVQLFSRKDMSTGVEGRHESHHIVCLLDSKTGLNVSVFLKQFKGGGKDVIGWIQTFGIKNVTVEQMTALEKLLPDTNTIDLLTSHSGNQKLGDAEVFLLQLIKIDKYVLRVEVMKLFLEFKEKKQELQPALQLVCKAIDEILKSKSLKSLLYIILVAGNFLNSGGYSGKAYGFTITSLDNLGDTRTNKPHMTFINYIASILQQQCPELLDVGKELPSLKEASRYIVGDITQQIQKLNKRFEQFQDKLNQTTDDFKQQAENILTSVRSGLEELMDDVKKTSDGKEAMMEFLCEDPLQCKLEEVLQCIMKFVDHLSTCAQENAKLEEVEKKREIQKATAGNAPVSSENVVDKLLHEIRDGTTLRHRC